MSAATAARSRVWAQCAWVGGELRRGVLIDVADGRFAAVTPDSPCSAGVRRLTGLTLPGFANAHSHAFHRALRGRTHAGRGTFWSWREQMYAVAGRLDPDSYRALARAAYAEMVLAGFSCVGEFHYVHHAPDGRPYGEPNAMSDALLAAAGDAGIRITLLDTCYLAGGIGMPLSPAQQRFGDRDVDAWAQRAAARTTPGNYARLGAAVHSVRAVPRDHIGAVAAWAAGRDAPLHAHASEQRAEVAACREAYGASPVRVLADAGALPARGIAVHAVHVDAADIAVLARSGAGVCICPTTERDLGDGVAPAGAFSAAGVPLSIGTDSHAVVDGLTEVRAMEMDERLIRETRGVLDTGSLLTALTTGGHAALGWDDAGLISVGARADLVTLSLGGVRLAGADDPVAAAVLAGTASDLTDVMVSGREVVREGRHVLVEDLPRALTESIAAVNP